MAVGEKKVFLMERSNGPNGRVTAPTYRLTDDYLERRQSELRPPETGAPEPQDH